MEIKSFGKSERPHKQSNILFDTIFIQVRLCKHLCVQKGNSNRNKKNEFSYATVRSGKI